MPLVVKDRVRETSTTAGTGTFTLAGAVLGYQSFSAIGDGNTTYYTIYLQGGNEWEVGIGTYTASGTTLSRDTILASSNAGSAVNFSAGVKDVFVTYPAGRSVWYDSATNVTLNALTLSGGTQNGVLYLNASKVATSGSALTFDGTTLATTGGINSDNTSTLAKTAGQSLVVGNLAASGAKLDVQTASGTAATFRLFQNGISNFVLSVPANTDALTFLQYGSSELMRLTSTGLTLRQSGAPANTSVSLNTTIQNALTLEADGDLLVGTTTNTNSSKLLASGTISETVSSTQYLVASQFDIGTAANEIPLNQYLGNLAYQDAGSIAGPVGLGGAVTLSSGTANGVAYLNASNVLTTGSALTFDGTNLLSTGGITSSGGDITVGTAGKFLYSNYVAQNSGSSLYLRGATASGQIEFQTNTTTKATLDSSGGLITKPVATGHAVFNEDGVDADFRVESDTNQYMLWVDASADGVNIGGFDTIQGQLNVIKNTGDLVASTTALYITTGQTYGSAANKKNLDLVFQGYRDGAGTGGGAKARLRAIEQTADSRVGSLLIDVLDSAGDLQNALELTSSNVVVNQGGIDMDFRVESDGSSHALFVDASANAVGIRYDTPLVPLQIGSFGSVSGMNETQLALTGASGFNAAAMVFNSSNTNYAAQFYFEPATGNINYRTTTNASTVTTHHVLAVDGAVTFNESGADADFRVESDTNTHALFVDAGNSRIGINQSNPTAALDMVGLGFYQYSPGSQYPVKRSVTESNQGSNASATYSLVARIDFGVSWSPGNFPVITVSRIYRDGVTNYIKYALINESTLEILENYNGGDVLRIKGPVTYNSNTGVYEIWIAQSSYTAYQIVFEGAWWGDSIPSTPTGQAVQVLTATEVAGTATTSAPAGLTQATNFYQNIYPNTESVFNEYGADLDFRVESDASTHALFVDAGANYVGINRSSAIQNGSSTITQLAVQSVINNGAILAPGLAVTNSTGYQDAFFVSTKDNEVWLDADHLTTQAGSKTAMIFRVNKTTTAGSLTQVAKFDFTGDVIFNDDSNDHDFRVESDSNTHALFVDAGNNAVGVSTSTPATGVAGYDGLIGVGQRGKILSAYNDSVAAAGYIDITVQSGGGAFNGFLTVSNVYTANAGVRTQVTYSIFGRGTTSFSAQLIATDDGETAGAALSISNPSAGVIRITNDYTQTTSLSAVFMGTTGF